MLAACVISTLVSVSPLSVSAKLKSDAWNVYVVLPNIVTVLSDAVGAVLMVPLILISRDEVSRALHALASLLLHSRSLSILHPVAPVSSSALEILNLIRLLDTPSLTVIQ